MVKQRKINIISRGWTTHPLFGLCKTPTILWILSMATLCWKLLKPVSQKHNSTISICTASLGKCRHMARAFLSDVHVPTTFTLPYL